MSQYVIFTFISIILFYKAPNIMDRSFLIVIILLVSLSIGLHFYKEKKTGISTMKKIYLRHSVFFIIFFSIVFFQYDIDYILGFVDTDNIQIWIDTRVVCRSLALSCASLNATLAGYWFYRFNYAKRLADTKLNYSTDMKSLLIILCFSLLLLYIVVVDKNFLDGGYAQQESGEAFTIIVMLQAVFLCIYAVYAYEYKQKNFNKPFISFFKYPLILLIAYMGVILISGRRTEAIRMFSMLFVVYLYCRGVNANYKQVILVGILGMLLFSSVSLLRASRADNLSQAISVQSDESSILPFTRELASSVNTLHVAVDYFPELVDYTNGLTFFPRFLLLIPGMDRLYLTYFEEDRYKGGSGAIITELNLGSNANYGMGSSIVADTYIAFGPILSNIFFFLLGIYMSYLEAGTFMCRKSPYFLIMSFGVYSQIPYACRGIMSSLFLSCSYAVLLYFFIAKFQAILNHR